MKTIIAAVILIIGYAFFVPHTHIDVHCKVEQKGLELKSLDCDISPKVLWQDAVRYIEGRLPWSNE
jgi:hypothetical protein